MLSQWMQESGSTSQEPSVMPDTWPTANRYVSPSSNWGWRGGSGYKVEMEEI